MKTKICTSCKKEKDLNEFHNHKTGVHGKSSVCKKCSSLRDSEYNKKYPWKRIWHDINTRCHNPKNKKYHLYGGRGIQNFLKENDVKDLWFRDEAWKLEKPSIDRIDSDGDYCMENCRFIELSFNSSRATKGKGRIVLQYDLNNNFIKEWNGAKDIKDTLGFCDIGVRAVCRGVYKQMYGFIWIYKK